MLLEGKVRQDSKFKIDFSAAVACGEYTDVVLVTRENLHIRAHKIVLSRDKFWYSLLRSVECCSSSCAQPVTVLLPDFSYRSVSRLIQGYYQDKVYFESIQEKNEFISDIKSFNQKLNIHDGTCRICGAAIRGERIVQHVLDHVKFSAAGDINNFITTLDKDMVKCRFTHPDICRIESDRKTVIHGIFNNVNIEREEDMVKLIREHYRRHLRDEIAHLKQIYGESICPSSFETLYCITEINEGSSRASEGPIEEREDDTRDSSGSKGQYSGGFSSPSNADKGEEVAPGTKKKTMKKKIPKVVPTKNTSYDSDDEASGCKVSTVTCRDCKKNCKNRSGFETHLVTHLYEEFKVPAIGPYHCTRPKCDNVKEYNKLKYIMHLARRHKELEALLNRRGETVSDWEMEPEDPDTNQKIRDELRCADPDDVMEAQHGSLDDRDKRTVKSRAPSGSKSPRSTGPKSPRGPKSQRGKEDMESKPPRYKRPGETAELSSKKRRISENSDGPDSDTEYKSNNRLFFEKSLKPDTQSPYKRRIIDLVNRPSPIGGGASSKHKSSIGGEAGNPKSVRGGETSSPKSVSGEEASKSKSVSGGEASKLKSGSVGDASKPRSNIGGEASKPKLISGGEATKPKTVSGWEAIKLKLVSSGETRKLQTTGGGKASKSRSEERSRILKALEKSSSSSSGSESSSGKASGSRNTLTLHSTEVSKLGSGLSVAPGSSLGTVKSYATDKVTVTGLSDAADKTALPGRSTGTAEATNTVAMTGSAQCTNTFAATGSATEGVAGPAEEPSSPSGSESYSDSGDSKSTQPYPVGHDDHFEATDNMDIEED